jgi:hypothetical protein
MASLDEDAILLQYNELEEGQQEGDLELEEGQHKLEEGAEECVVAALALPLSLKASGWDLLPASTWDNGGEDHMPSAAPTAGRQSCWQQDGLSQWLQQPVQEKCHLPAAYASCGP